MAHEQPPPSVLNHANDHSHTTTDAFTTLLRTRDELIAQNRLEEILPYLESAEIDSAVRGKFASDVAVDLLEQGLPAQAHAALSLALLLCPELTEAHYNMGITLQELGRTQEAYLALSLVLLQRPELPEAWLGLAQTLDAAGKPQDALEACEKAQSLRPSWGAPAALAALICLREGFWSRGWSLFENRFHAEHPAQLHLKPVNERCDPLNLPDRGELLVIAEQGLGDTLQFARFAAQLRRPGRTVSLCVQEQLRDILADAELADRVITPEEAGMINGNGWLPLLSLPHALRVFDASAIPQTPYLQTHPKRVQHWQSLLRPANASPRLIGIHWQGNPSSERNNLRGRSLPLECLAPLTESPDICLVSLQKGHGSEQLDNCSFRHRFTPIQDQISASLDFRDVAAQLMVCDLLITNDSAIAHLAGALGRPTWLLLHHSADWRWGVERTSTPWYSSIRLFRQTEAGNWQDVVKMVCSHLNRMASGTAN